MLHVRSEDVHEQVPLPECGMRPVLSCPWILDVCPPGQDGQGDGDGRLIQDLCWGGAMARARFRVGWANALLVRMG